jgi:hypothetical protein
MNIEPITIPKPDIKPDTKPAPEPVPEEWDVPKPKKNPTPKA